HGYTAGAHPVGAAVALENINIIEERELVRNAADVGAYMISRLNGLLDHELVGEVRGKGLIAAVEVVAPNGRDMEFPPGELGRRMNALMTENGLISRNMIDALAFCPPLIITHGEVDEMIGILARSLDQLANQLA